MIKTIRGVIINETPHKESSKILSVLTEDGIISLISKGCKSLKSPLRMISNKLSYNEFVIYYHEDGLSLLKEGSIINYFDKIKSDLLLNSYLIYITDLTKQVISEGDSKVIFNTYIEAVTKINEGFNPKIITNILEVKFLDYLGAPINFKSCVKCGNDKDIVTISARDGGYICKDCYTNELVYDSKMFKMLKMYYLVDIKTITELKISDSIIESINEFLTDYYDSYTGIYIKSKSFLNTILE